MFRGGKGGSLRGRGPRRRGSGSKARAARRSPSLSSATRVAGSRPRTTFEEGLATSLKNLCKISETSPVCSATTQKQLCNISATSCCRGLYQFSLTKLKAAEISALQQLVAEMLQSCCWALAALVRVLSTEVVLRFFRTFSRRTSGCCWSVSWNWVEPVFFGVVTWNGVVSLGGISALFLNRLGLNLGDVG